MLLPDNILDVNSLGFPDTLALGGMDTTGPRRIRRRLYALGKTRGQAAQDDGFQTPLMDVYNHPQSSPHVDDYGIMRATIHVLPDARIALVATPTSFGERTLPVFDPNGSDTDVVYLGVDTIDQSEDDLLLVELSLGVDTGTDENVFFTPNDTFRGQISVLQQQRLVDWGASIVIEGADGIHPLDNVANFRDVAQNGNYYSHTQYITNRQEHILIETANQDDLRWVLFGQNHLLHTLDDLPEGWTLAAPDDPPVDTQGREEGDTGANSDGQGFEPRGVYYCDVHFTYGYAGLDSDTAYITGVGLINEMQDNQNGDMNGGMPPAQRGFGAGWGPGWG